MSIRVSASLLLLIALVLSLSVGAAQDPTAPTAAMPQTDQPDLSGTYTGTFNCESAGLMGETTLTITGNQFTTADGKTGRIVASRSGGYTAVAFQVGEVTTGTTGGTTGAAATPPRIFSMRARKVGNRLIMTPAPGTMMKCSFTPGRATGRGRQRTPPATGTEVANPSTSPMPTTSPETPMPEQTPSPSPEPSPTASPSPSPSPEPSPEPNPSPMPSPSPVPSPDPDPSPMPSPTATPSPTPSPSPRRA